MRPFYASGCLMSYRFFGIEYNERLYIETLRRDLGEIGLQAFDENPGGRRQGSVARVDQTGGPAWRWDGKRHDP